MTIADKTLSGSLCFFANLLTDKLLPGRLLMNKFGVKNSLDAMKDEAARVFVCLLCGALTPD